MCDFFSGILMKDGKVLTLGNSNSHESIIKENKLDDSLVVDDPKRNWVRFELNPKPDILAPARDWVFKVDESSTPTWLNDRYERAAREYVQKNICDTPWMLNTKKEIRRIKKIRWFKPMSEPKVEDLLPLAQELGKAFKIRGKIKVKLIPLTESAAWSAAESAARSAARSAAESAARSAARSAAESAAWSAAESAAESAAWSAAFECSVDANKKYKINPFKLMVNLWMQGYYCCGIHNKTLTLGYIPKKTRTKRRCLK